MDVSRIWVHKGDISEKRYHNPKTNKECPVPFYSALTISPKQVFVGKYTGEILCFANQTSRPIIFPGHSQSVTSLIYVRSVVDGVIFSGSSDRTIRLWDIKKPPEKSCVQVIHGHGGTINRLNFLDEILISCSTDCTIRLWKNEDGRELLLYPYFIQMQVITIKDIWVQDLTLHFGDYSQLYLACSNGDMIVYERTPYSKEFEVKDNYNNVHTLSITRCLLIYEENLIITISYDNTCCIYYADNGNIVLELQNERRCRFTALDWHYLYHELYLCDDSGYVEIWDIFLRRLKKKDQISNSSINEIKCRQNTNNFVIQLKSKCCEFTVIRDLDYKLYEGHSEAVIGLTNVDAVLNNIGDQPRIYSVGQDSKIITWDPYDMSPLLTFNDTDSETTCIIYLTGCKLILTGSENGTLKWWNPDSGSYLAMQNHNNTVSSIDFVEQPREDIIASCDYDGAICIWTCAKRRSMTPHLECKIDTTTSNNNHGLDSELLTVKWINSLYNNEETWLVACGGNDKVIRVFDYTNHMMVLDLKGHRDSITVLNFDNNFLFSGSEDGDIIIWNIRLLTETYKLCKYHCHECSIRCITILDNGFIMSTAFDGKINVWDYDPDRINQRKTNREKEEERRIKEEYSDDEDNNLPIIQKEMERVPTEEELLEDENGQIECIYTIKHKYKCWCVICRKEMDKCTVFAGMDEGKIITYTITNDVFEVPEDTDDLDNTTEENVINTEEEKENTE